MQQVNETQTNSFRGKRRHFHHSFIVKRNSTASHIPINRQFGQGDTPRAGSLTIFLLFYHNIGREEEGGEKSKNEWDIPRGLADD